ncbi:hypothetical protein Q8F55_001861 [Vanrija albida]|uniref:Sld7 C-terminal domain-containing protein n=1 Tax=Vanrija albida TaxID=181172 RepID=A0ABR3Q857_9TREE
MAALLTPDAAAPSPTARPNPFAKATTSAGHVSFSRSTSALLPLRSPSTAATPGPPRRPWRLLWRGGLEVGPDGWRLDGITFFAVLNFARDKDSANPFAPPTPRASTPTSSPLHSDADLCLSLESLRGRKYLPVRGLVPLADGELDSDDSVQISIESPLLASFFTSSLCAGAKLTPGGRTPVAIEVGLGDEGVEASTIVIYGQRRDDAALRLCVGRRVAPPAAEPSPRKVRPGEPLPRAPLLFPTKAARRPRPPLSRSSSAAVYAPPPVPAAVPDGRTPGRRGEKRPRKDEGDADDRRRRAGRVVKPERDKDADEDIFGRRSASVAPRAASVAPPPSHAPAGAPDTEVEAAAAPARTPRARVPQQTLDNKAMIRKQTMVLLELRGVARDHALFKDVFTLTTKGTYFAVRNAIDTGVLDKSRAQDIIARHLDMYLDEGGVEVPGGGVAAPPDDGDEATDKDE